MIVAAAKRIFKLKQGKADVELPDPDANMTVEQVRKFYMDQYPELATATLGEHVFEGDTLTYTFTQSVGEFG